MNRIARRAPRITALAAALMSAAVLGACGGSDEDDITKVAKDLAAAKPEVCKSVTDAFLKLANTSRADCEKEIKEGDKANVTFQKPKVDGETATISGKEKGQNEETVLKFKKEDGEWKLDGVQQ